MAKGTCTLPPDHTMGWTRSRLGVKTCTSSFTNFHSSYLSGLGTFLQFPRGQPSHLEQEGFRSDELEGHFQLENCMTHSADYCLWQGKNEVGFAFCLQTRYLWQDKAFKEPQWDLRKGRGSVTLAGRTQWWFPTQEAPSSRAVPIVTVTQRPVFTQEKSFPTRLVLTKMLPLCGSVPRWTEDQNMYLEPTQVWGRPP